MLSKLRPSFVPREEIPPGDETDRLHRWGYRLYREMFNDRQLLGLPRPAFVSGMFEVDGEAVALLDLDALLAPELYDAERRTA